MALTYDPTKGEYLLNFQVMATGKATTVLEVIPADATAEHIESVVRKAAEDVIWNLRKVGAIK